MFATASEELCLCDLATKAALSSQELLKRCMDQLQDNGQRIKALEAHLQDLGPYPLFNPPAQEQPEPLVICCIRAMINPQV